MYTVFGYVIPLIAICHVEYLHVRFEIIRKLQQYA